MQVNNLWQSLHQIPKLDQLYSNSNVMEWNGLYIPFSWKQDPGAVIKFNLENKITQINYNYPEKS